MEAKITADISRSYDPYNTTIETPRESMPRPYSPVGLGLGLTFGIAAIIAIVLVLMFIYRRYKEAAENQRYVK